MSDTLEVCLIILVIVTIILLIVVSVYLVRLLIEVSKLVSNMNDVSLVLKNDMSSIMSELKVSINGINAFVSATNKKVIDLKNIVSRLFGAGSVAVIGAKNLTGGFLKGLSAGFNVFRKK